MSKFTQSSGFGSFYIGKGLLTLGKVVSSLALSTIVSAFTGNVSISAGIPFSYPPLFAFFQLIKSHPYLLPLESRAFAAVIAWKEPKAGGKNEVEIGLQGNCGLQAF